MKKVKTIAKWFFLIFGVVSFIGAVALGGILVYSIGPGNKNRSEFASKKDVRFILNRCNLGDKQVEEVVHSYESSRSFTGDHLDAYALRISDISIDELTTEADCPRSHWCRSDKATGIVADALDFMQGWVPSDEASWFPSMEQIRTDQFYAYTLGIYYPGNKPNSVSLILINPKSKMVYYFSGKY